jgi:exopolysaccharide biosynthesis polyprenyl glycosylphosphotransferase
MAEESFPIFDPARRVGQLTGATTRRSSRRFSVRLHASERKIVLAVVDVLLLCTALVIAIEAQADWFDSLGAVLAPYKWWITLALVWLPLATLLEAYDLPRASSAPNSILSAAAATVLTLLVYSLIPWLTPPLGSRGLLFMSILVAVGLISLWRGFYAILFVQPAFHEQGLVVGAGWAGAYLARALQAVPAFGNPFNGTGYRILGFVDDDPAKQVEAAVAGLPVLGDCQTLPHLARQLGADEIVLAITHRHTMSAATFDALMACREQGIRITTMPALYERLLGRVPVEHVGRDLGAVLPIHTGPIDRLYWASKRAMDVVLGIAGLVPLALIIPLVALGNQLSSPGPLFYRQERVGKGGRAFHVIKFRTMVPNAESQTGVVWAAEEDPRVTPLGRWMRKMRIDELPQLVNIIRGEMSLVGPRPERPEFVEHLAREISFYRARHAVRPGLTGWAQVRYGYGSSVADTRVKLEYDLYYVRHAGFYLEALILLKTLAVVLRLQGR